MDEIALLLADHDRAVIIPGDAAPAEQHSSDPLFGFRNRDPQSNPLVGHENGLVVQESRPMDRIAVQAKRPLEKHRRGLIQVGCCQRVDAPRAAIRQHAGFGFPVELHPQGTVLDLRNGKVANLDHRVKDLDRVLSGLDEVKDTNFLFLVLRLGKSGDNSGGHVKTFGLNNMAHCTNSAVETPKFKFQGGNLSTMSRIATSHARGSCQ